MSGLCRDSGTLACFVQCEAAGLLVPEERAGWQVGETSICPRWEAIVSVCLSEFLCFAHLEHTVSL